MFCLLSFLLFLFAYRMESKSLFDWKSVFLILNGFKTIKQNFYYFSLNFELRFISRYFTVTNFVSNISKTRFVIALLVMLIILVLIIKTYYLVLKVFKLKNVFFYLKKKQKLKKNSILKVQAGYQIVSYQAVSILTDFSHILFLCRFLTYFLYI